MTIPSHLLLQKLRRNHVGGNHGMHGRHAHGRRHRRHRGHVDHASGDRGIMRRQFLVCRAKIIFLVLQVILVRRQRLLAVLLSLMNPTVSGVLSVNGRFLSLFLSGY